MAECKYLLDCIFYSSRMTPMPATAQSMKNRLCLEESTDCARQMVFENLGAASVPDDLYPYNVDRARRIIAEENVAVAA